MKGFFQKSTFVAFLSLALLNGCSDDQKGDRVDGGPIGFGGPGGGPTGFGGPGAGPGVFGPGPGGPGGPGFGSGPGGPGGTPFVVGVPNSGPLYIPNQSGRPSPGQVAPPNGAPIGQPNGDPNLLEPDPLVIPQNQGGVPGGLPQGQPQVPQIPQTQIPAQPNGMTMAMGPRGYDPSSILALPNGRPGPMMPAPIAPNVNLPRLTAYFRSFTHQLTGQPVLTPSDAQLEAQWVIQARLNPSEVHQTLVMFRNLTDSQGKVMFPGQNFIEVTNKVFEANPRFRAALFMDSYRWHLRRGEAPEVAIRNALRDSGL